MDWYPVISVQQRTPDDDFCHFRISNVRFAFWAFFRKPEKLGSHTGSKWWPSDPDVRDDPNDPLTRWPNDPVPCLAHTALAVRGHGPCDYHFWQWSVATPPRIHGPFDLPVNLNPDSLCESESRFGQTEYSVRYLDICLFYSTGWVKKSKLLYCDRYFKA